ncbi:cyclic nucleotide-binding domain-containing protein [Vallitalea sp.]|uniref:cyclic nucleotide-binding domain-containing protein n=1 Tax=Vallitalea sp. TaxID=1882829 RepID=UPI0025DC60E2|nr:cyclic nucleotide-binding domain-containing protein [Vallitalea sp.]MCT4687228.1 cyclic nucleotide-binding domain-containing protein [Vallitalea sp.]
MQTYKDIELFNIYNKKYKLYEIFGDDLDNYYEFHLFEKGELICKMDEPVYYFYLLVDGKAKVFTLSEDGRILLHEFYKSISDFGDIEILNNTNYRTNVEAIKQSLFIAFPVNYINSICMNRKAFLQYLCVTLSRKFMISSKKSSYNILYPLKNRLSAFILEHITVEGQRLITLTSSYKEIAESLGTSYRHLYRCLNELKLLGLIEIDGKQIRIVDEVNLRKLSKEL